MSINDIKEYEQSNIIYMNFSVNDNKLFGLPEGDKTQHYINNERLIKYETFLDSAISYFEKFESYYKTNHCFEELKKLKKYKTYKKRLEKAKNKMSKGV